jgi:hypothetical protein
MVRVLVGDEHRIGTSDVVANHLATHIRAAIDKESPAGLQQK